MWEGTQNGEVESRCVEWTVGAGELEDILSENWRPYHPDSMQRAPPPRWVLSLLSCDVLLLHSVSWCPPPPSTPSFLNLLSCDALLLHSLCCYPSVLSLFTMRSWTTPLPPALLTKDCLSTASTALPQFGTRTDRLILQRTSYPYTYTMYLIYLYVLAVPIMLLLVRLYRSAELAYRIVLVL